MYTHNTSRTILASVAKTATYTGDAQVNATHTGMHLIVDATVIAGGETITPKIQGQDAASGKWYDVLVGAAISATGTTVLKIGAGITAVPSASAADFVPFAWRVVVTHSASGSHTYSIGVVMFP